MTDRDPTTDRKAEGNEAVACAFGPCTCRVTPVDEYCTPTCRFGLGSRKEPCKCGHGDCKATSGKG
jgi:hypothetical protein